MRERLRLKWARKKCMLQADFVTLVKRNGKIFLIIQFLTVLEYVFNAEGKLIFYLHIIQLKFQITQSCSDLRVCGSSVRFVQSLRRSSVDISGMAPTAVAFLQSCLIYLKSFVNVLFTRYCCILCSIKTHGSRIFSSSFLLIIMENFSLWIFLVSLPFLIMNQAH